MSPRVDAYSPVAEKSPLDTKLNSAIWAAAELILSRRGTGRCSPSNLVIDDGVSQFPEGVAFRFAQVTCIHLLDKLWAACGRAAQRLLFAVLGNLRVISALQHIGDITLAPSRWLGVDGVLQKPIGMRFLHQ